MIACCLLETFNFQRTDSISLQFVTFGKEHKRENLRVCACEFRHGSIDNKARFGKNMNEISAMFKVVNSGH